MAKRMRKSEKLDLILSELSALRSDVAKLAKQHSALSAELASVKPRRAPQRPAAKPAKKPRAPTKATKANKASQTRKVPVLVEAESTPHPTSRVSSS
jgi:septal ring factor EnvC (AmiA/AmiB activator)